MRVHLVSTNGDKNADSFCISISCLSRSAGTFIAAGVKNNVSLCNKNPNPGVQRTSNKEFRNNRSYFARPFPFESSGIPGKAGTFTNFHLCPNGGICLCSHLLFRVFSPLSLSLHYLPPVLPPFFSSSSPNRGPSDWLLIYKCLCVLKSGTKGVGL